MEKEFWKDYFDLLGNALQRFEEIMKHPDLDKFDYMHDAAIQRFEFCIEIYWRVLKKILAYEKVETTTLRDVLCKAYQFEFINDESIWLSILDDKNRSSHVYKESEAERIFQNLARYLPVMMKTYQFLKEKF